MSDIGGEIDEAPIDRLAAKANIRRELVEVLLHAQQIGAIGAASLVDHIAHASAFADAWGESLTGEVALLDLGSGGGLPGLVLAERHIGLRCTLLDGRVERARLLCSAVARLGIGARIQVVGIRAEIAGFDPELREHFDVVVARSFGSPGTTAECASPFLRLGGLLVVSEPPDRTESADRWPADGCARVGLQPAELRPGPPSLMVLRKVSPTPDGIPRRVGIPAKRPLF